MIKRSTAWTVAIVATLTMTVSYVDRITLAVLAPTVTKVLGISDEAYGWLGSVFSAAYLFATPFTGWWIDRIGARRGLVSSLLAWSVVAALHAVIPGFGALFVLRIALGITEGPSFPGAAQTIQRILPARERERGFGVLFTGSSIGAMIAPPLASGVFRLTDSWRTAFLVTTAAGLIWIPAWLFVTRSRAVRAQLDVAPDDAAAQEPRPSLVRLVRHPIMIRALCGVFAAAPVFGFAQTWGAKYLVLTFKLGQGEVGRYLWLPPLMFDLGAVVFGDLASRQRRLEGTPPRLLYAIGIALAAALALLSRADTPWQAMWIMGTAMAGGGVMYTLTTADMLARMPPGSVSFAGGVLAGAQSLALIIANPVIGRVIDHLHSYDAIGFGLAGWAMPGALIWLAWTPPAHFTPRTTNLPRAQATG
ncbi:MAG TPA: MFS transporter [Kofleriaceae bacterium]|nr:MFS transporter [Kofleriaceae bacterium]